MKVLVASHLYPSSFSLTSGSFVHNQVRFLSAHCSIRVVSPTPWFPSLPGFGRWSGYGRVKHREIRDGVEVKRPSYLTLPRRMVFGRAWRSHLAALRRATDSPPDLIHAHCAYPDGLAAVHYGERLGAPAVITVHGHDIRDLGGSTSPWRKLVVEALDRAALVIANGPDLYERMRELGISTHKMEIIPNGVDCEVFDSDFRRRPGERGWHLLYVGRFTEQKGVGVLLQAMAILRQKRDDVRLTLIGGGEKTGRAAVFYRQTEALGLRDCVEFFDELPWSQIPRYMNAADVFVLPSFYESFGLVLVEAMACGLPLVATRCGGPNNLVEQGTGLLVGVDDAEDLARGVEEVLKTYSHYDRRAIRRRAREKYDYRQVAARIYRVYKTDLRI